MQHIDHARAVERARALKLHSPLDAAFLAIMEQISPVKPLTLDAAVAALDNDQILEYAAFLFQSRTHEDLERPCRSQPPSAESEREWLLTEDQACLARKIAAVASDLDS